MVNWHLLPDEKKIHETQISRKLPYFLKFYLIIGFLVISAIWLLFSNLTLPVSKYLLSLVLIVIAVLIDFVIVGRERKREMILLTTNRILVRKQGGGLMKDLEKGQVKTEQIDLDSIVNISVSQQGFLKSKILNIGDITFVVSGIDHVVRNVDDPYKMERAVYRIIGEEKKLEGIKA